MWEENINQPPIGDRACKPGMCPGRELKQPPFQCTRQHSTEPHWPEHSDLFVMRSCQNSSTMPSRIQDTGKQKWEVWTRGTRRSSLTPVLNVLSQTFNTSSDWPSEEILFEKQSLDLAGVGVRRNHSIPSISVKSALWSTMIDTPQWVFNSATQIFIDHLLREMCRWGTIKGDNSQNVPHSRKLRKVLWKR